MHVVLLCALVFLWKQTQLVMLLWFYSRSPAHYEWQTKIRCVHRTRHVDERRTSCSSQLQR